MDARQHPMEKEKAYMDFDQVSKTPWAHHGLWPGEQNTMSTPSSECENNFLMY
jgi:ribonuclease I